jgi:release factor glutamine methyltransferase
MRLLDLLRKSTDCLEAAGIDEAFADAELLVFHAANMDRIDAYVNNPEVKSSDSAKVRRLLQRRLKGEPVQYIVGQIEFLGLTIKVGRGVLIPRPETELLVEEAIKAVMRNKISVASKEKNALRVTQRASLSVLDLCTGSGCIALSLAKEFPDAEVYGTELSKEALVYAKKNAKANDIKNVAFLQGSLFEPVKGKAYDLITANPPYIRRSELETLQREIRDWEPISALDGGEDGMDFYRTILSSADQFLNPGGSLFLELGYDQAEAVKKVAKRQGFLDLAVINDYAGIGRILAVRR